MKKTVWKTVFLIFLAMSIIFCAVMFVYNIVNAIKFIDDLGYHYEIGSIFARGTPTKVFLIWTFAGLQYLFAIFCEVFLSVKFINKEFWAEVKKFISDANARRKEKQKAKKQYIIERKKREIEQIEKEINQ